MTWGKNRQNFDGFSLIGTTNVLGHRKTSSGWGEVEPKEIGGLSGIQGIACAHMHTAFIVG